MPFEDVERDLLHVCTGLSGIIRIQVCLSDERVAYLTNLVSVFLADTCIYKIVL